MARVAIFLVICALLDGLSVELWATTNRNVRVLFIGNSYTYADDIPWITRQLAASANDGCSVETDMVAFPGATLRMHWEKGDVIAKLRDSKWDFVVMQEQSMVPLTNPAEMRRYARLFAHEIHLNSATPVLFVTWPRKHRPELQTRITEIYTATAKDIKALLAPVGPTWEMVLAKDSNLELFHQDGSHPSPLGSYIGACVFYSVFCKKSPDGLMRTVYARPAPGAHSPVITLPKEQAAFLHKVVWQTVQSNTIDLVAPRP